MLCPYHSIDFTATSIHIQMIQSLYFGSPNDLIPDITNAKYHQTTVCREKRSNIPEPRDKIGKSHEYDKHQTTNKSVKCQIWL